MEYTQGALGRIFVLKLKDQEDLLAGLNEFAGREKIKAGVFVCIGALREGKAVTGPKKPAIPPEPNWREFSQGWELLGAGTVFASTDGPQIHLHGSLGKAASVITGCLRQRAQVYLVMEVIFFELKNVKAHKNLDPETGLHLLQLIAPRICAAAPAKAARPRPASRSSKK